MPFVQVQPWEQNLPKIHFQREEAMLKEHVIPMKKLATTQEVVNAVLWLSSDQASHTTGQKIFIDGGMHIA